MTSMISYSTEVQQALEDKKPIVALESTIISHACRIRRMLKQPAW